LSKLPDHDITIDGNDLVELSMHGHIATLKTATKKDVKKVLAADEDSDDGRSQFMWIRLTTGELILGVFPQGDTYQDIEYCC
jgi:hypothetical protein